jgi:hypothetical protein
MQDIVENLSLSASVQASVIAMAARFVKSNETHVIMQVHVQGYRSPGQFAQTLLSLGEGKVSGRSGIFGL